MMKFLMTAGVFGIATTAAIGCGNTDDSMVAVGVAHQADTYCGAGATLVNTTESGAQSWISHNCGGAGGAYSGYTNGVGGTGPICVACNNSSGPTGSPGYTGTGGYPVDNGGSSSGDPHPSGSTGSTTPPPPPPVSSAEPDPNEPRFLCTCCNAGIEWQDRVGSMASVLDSCGSYNGACVPITHHPSKLDSFDTGATPLGLSGAYVLDGSPQTAYYQDAPTWWGFVGGGYGANVTTTHYWGQFDDGDTLRFFDQDSGANDPASSLGDLLSLGVSWSKVPYGISIANNVISGSTGNDSLAQLQAAYNQNGLKNGVYLRIDETFTKLNTQSNAVCAGRLDVNYTLYSQSDDRLLGAVNARYCAIDVPGQPTYIPGQRAGAVSNPSNATSNLRPPQERYYSVLKANLSAVCQQQQQPQQPQNCGDGQCIPAEQAY